MTYFFSFDASACSGCKACQIACKDKNELPLGVLWRRVIEVSGGSWTRQKEAWVTDVFAYNLSMACNHCVHPKCAGVCPTQAYTVREDGIVLLNKSSCIGCRYCSWACPYGVPQYDWTVGRMTKCDLCVDQLEEGLPPACVAACPMRVLELVEQRDSETLQMEEQKIYPMPAYSHTEPRMVIRLHAEAHRGGKGMISNDEEIRPMKSGRWSELPLVAFTLLAQMAVGTFWLVALGVFGLKEFMGGREMAFPAALTAGILVIAALGISLLHLGAPMNSWRSLMHLRKSWLSREILTVFCFAGFLGLSLAFWNIPGDSLIKQPFKGLWEILVIATTLFGVAGITSMANVYYLKTIPTWKKGRTLTAFLLSSFVLGQAMIGLLLAVDGLQDGDWQRMVFRGLGISMVVTLVVIAGIFQLVEQRRVSKTSKVRWGLSLLAIGGALAMIIIPVQMGILGVALIFLIILAEESLGRWMFYEALKEKIL